MDAGRINPEIIRVTPSKQPAGSAPSSAASPGFGAALDKAMSLRFSDHAQGRMSRYGISLDAAAKTRLETAVTKAAAKGARESLVLLDDKAFVVSVRNKTVITAIDRMNMKEHVFTNIDSAVIA